MCDWFYKISKTTKLFIFTLRRNVIKVCDEISLNWMDSRYINMKNIWTCYNSGFGLKQNFYYKKFKKFCNLTSWEYNHTYFKTLYFLVVFIRIYPHAKISNSYLYRFLRCKAFKDPAILLIESTFRACLGISDQK